MRKKIIKIIVLCTVLFWVAVFLSLKFAPKFTLDKLMNAHKMVIGGEQSTIKISDHEISYLKVGKGDTVLFVHGVMASKMMWYPMIFKMVPKYHIVDIDLPGFGESSKNDTADYSIMAQSKRLEQIVGKLGLTNFHLAGSSMGGAITTQFTIDNPEKVKSLALFNSAGIYSADTSDYLRLVLKGDNIFIMRAEQDIKRIFDYLFFNPPKIAELLNVHVLIGKENLQYADFYENMMDTIFSNQFSVENELEKIDAPAVIFWGDQDRILHKSSAHVFNDKMRNSELHIFENCGHLPMIEKAKETSKLYKEFLKNK